MVSEEISALRYFEKPQNRIRDTIKNLPDSELVNCCVNKPTNISWTEFYRRFNRLIDKRIYKTLIEYHVPLKPDDIDDIRFRIIEKIHGKNILHEAIGHENFHAWLAKTARHSTVDWIRSKSRQKNSYNLSVDNSMTSLSNPLDDEGKIRLVDTISTPAPQDKYDDEIKMVLKEVNGLEGLQRLVLRVNIVFYEPLSEEDIDEIAAIRARPPSEIVQEINDVMNSLLKKYEKLQHNQNRMFIVSSFLDRLKRKLHVLERQPVEKLSQIIIVKEEIEEKTEQLTRLQSRKEKQSIHPSAKQIANFLGLAREKEKNINVWLYRARQVLKKRCGV
jgi:DNA-directed RNA polymerase specialized sigma24 family protein